MAYANSIDIPTKLPSEEWRVVVGFEGLYEVSSFGRIKSLARLDRMGRIVSEKILKNARLSGRYMRIRLRKNNRTIDKGVHVLVLEAFVGQRPKGTYTHCAAFHLHRYATEEAFRFNERELNDARRFLLVLMGVVGKRLTYRKLAAIGDAGFMGLE